MPIFRFLFLCTMASVAVIFFYYRTTDGDAHIAPHAGDTGAIQKSELPVLIQKKQLINALESSFDVTLGGVGFQVHTSLDASLQKYLHERLYRSTSRYIGIIVMEPATGRILAMVGYDKIDPKNNPCLGNRFPAASVFKIVTAAAAVETYGFQPESVFQYNGGKYTLYRNQLKDRKTRYTHNINLLDSFAQSVNPVFGIIGAKRLGRSGLKKYAEAFGFNHPIRFELPLTPSEVHLTEEPYQWAEIASGFNRDTTLSPVHGAMMVSAIVNGGQMMEPTVVDRVEDGQGRVLYQSRPAPMKRVIESETSDVLNELMRGTVKSGTSRKAFRGHRKDRILSKLNIGGKTGSINSKKQDARFDWFVGFAEEREGDKKIAMAVVVAHQKYIGTRASQYAQMTIKRHFRQYYSRDMAGTEKRRNSS